MCGDFWQSCMHSHRSIYNMTVVWLSRSAEMFRTFSRQRKHCCMDFEMKTLMFLWTICSVVPRNLNKIGCFLRTVLAQKNCCFFRFHLIFRRDSTWSYWVHQNSHCNYSEPLALSSIYAHLHSFLRYCLMNYGKF